MEHQTGNGDLKVLKDVKYGNREARKKGDDSLEADIGAQIAMDRGEESEMKIQVFVKREMWGCIERMEYRTTPRLLTLDDKGIVVSDNRILEEEIDERLYLVPVNNKIKVLDVRRAVTRGGKKAAIFYRCRQRRGDSKTLDNQ